MKRRVFICAGEASGDHHGAALVEAALRKDPGLEFFGLAGPAMRAAGVRALVRVEDVAVAGLTEVLTSLPRLRRILSELTAALDSERPDLLLPIDYPDFNLRLARRAKDRGLPVLYYVSPQVWAWRRGRLRDIARVVDRMMVLFPFEEPLYREAGVPVTWVGHPLADAAGLRPERRAARERLGVPQGAPLVALLPGSRPGEVARILPVLVQAAHLLHAQDPERRFVVPVAPTLDPALVARHTGVSPVRPLRDALADVLAAADAAAVASGTATLEVALAGVPMVIVYRLSPVTALIARRAISVRDIGLANLVAGERVAEELVQEECTPRSVARAIEALLDPLAAAAARASLASVRERLGPAGASDRAAAVLLDLLATRVEVPPRVSV